MGITPAHAGKTTTLWLVVRFFQDHPRSRGKDHSMPSGLDTYGGSPPLTRERHDGGELIWLRFRITPAHAGKTCFNGFLPSLVGDHPRSRGKDTVHFALVLSALGSPPLTRERQWLYNKKISGGRITPAHAGKTKSPQVKAAMIWDHPRSRGKDSQVFLLIS